MAEIPEHTRKVSWRALLGDNIPLHSNLKVQSAVEVGIVSSHRAKSRHALL